MTRGRVLLILLSIWALLMVVPDLVRVVRPLSSLGFFADNNGLIYDVTGPFAEESASPAWKAGVRAGDQIDLARMRCLPYDATVCADTLAAVGGNLYVVPRRQVTLYLAPAGDKPAREVTLTAEQRMSNWLVRGVLLLDQLAAIAAVLAAAWLVWTRPGAMSWGFFLYVIWFNPGQCFEFYAQLQRWPLLLLLQDVVGCISQAVGYAGLLLFVMRAPTNEPQPRWARFERMLAPFAAVITVALMLSYGSAFGFGVETLTRATILFGLIVSAAAVAILLIRRQTLSPKDNQRLRWVLWGCLIGLPAFVLADLSEYTTIFLTDVNIPEDVIGLMYLVNGVLSLFVFEAIRRQRVVSVSIPLRRVTLLALVTSVPALLLHQQAEHIEELLDIPEWSWFIIGAIIVFLIGQIHHRAVEMADEYFNRPLDKAEIEIGEAILQAKDAAAVDQLLANGASTALQLTSAVTFRRDGSRFHRYDAGSGWDAEAVRDLRLGDGEIVRLLEGLPCTIDDRGARRAAFPPHIETPILAVPAASRAHAYAATLYGPHATGTDIDPNEKQLLESLGRHAADAYARLENEELRRRIAELEAQMALGREPV